jgi:hypothetical protein
VTTFHTPGVYLERRAASTLAIGLPRTDIAAFAGIAMRGPLFTPVKVENWTQFVSEFGGFIAQGFLAYAIHGFFANGGPLQHLRRVSLGGCMFPLDRRVRGAMEFKCTPFSKAPKSSP